MKKRVQHWLYAAFPNLPAARRYHEDRELEQRIAAEKAKQQRWTNWLINEGVFKKRPY